MICSEHIRHDASSSWALVSPPHSARAWGPIVHETVTAKAIDTLPGDLKGFYKDHRREMPALSPRAARSAEEGPDRRFAVDHLLPFPFTDLPRTEAGREGEIR